MRRRSLAYDLWASLKALWDAHVWPSRIWKRIKAETQHGPH